MIDNPALEVLLNPGTLPGAIFYAVLLALLALIASMVLRRFMHRAIGRAKRSYIDRTAATFLSQFLQVSFFVIASIIYFHIVPALRAIGTAILATAGVASIVLGLAAQNTLGNIISGISLLLYRPVRVGDKVKVYASAGDETGVVESITLGYTTLTMPDNEQIIVPNSVLASTVIVNYGRQESSE
jgi:small-conductance mechanosensitive channel